MLSVNLSARHRLTAGAILLTAWSALLWNAARVQAQIEDSRERRRTPIVEVFEKTRDSVVNIAATQVVEADPTMGLFPFRDMFDFPTPRQPRRYERTNLGSGFILHPDGFVVTNAHVVAQAAALEVVFADGTKLPAEPISIDEKHDLAILKITANQKFPALLLGRSNDLMIGETVIAIGNPLGYQHTVTTGIVSALDRKLEFNNSAVYEHLIQTDASINRGNSGGPLLNVLGELIGINTAIRGDAQNIGFAIPVDALRALLPEMLSIRHRKSRLDIGLRIGGRGRMHVVEATGPAARAGILPGDVIVQMNDEPLADDVDFFIRLMEIEPDDQVRFALDRDGETVDATLVPTTLPIPDGAQLLREKFGLQVRLLTEDQSRQFDVDGRLLITGVDADSPAARAGFISGLIIFQIGRHFPTDLDDVGLLLENVRRGDRVTFKVYEVQRNFLRVLTGSLVAR